jgi:hypothetical protein
MRVRHKIPSVFSLSMVDVLCCALGCVILIWLLNSKMSADEAADAEKERNHLLDEARDNKLKSDDRLKKSEDRLKARDALLADARADALKLDSRLLDIVKDRDRAVVLAAKLTERIAELEKDRLTLLAALEADKKDIAGLKGQLGKSAEKSAKLELDLKSMLERYEKQRTVTVKLDADLAALLVRIRTTEVDLEKSKKRELDEKARAELLKKSIKIKEADLLALAALLDEAKKASDRLKKSLDGRDLELAAAKKDRINLAELIRLREVALEDADKAVKRLEGEKLVLRTAIDNRFAGIELTGKRVVFLVDMSGSMVYVDEKTKAPQKWVEVRETVAKLMKSLGGLEKFQVVTFNSEAKYPLGSPGKWVTFDRKASPARVARALEAIKPAGDTDMHIALEHAFRFRKDGLDTIYLLSDGLPNLGEGLEGMSVKDRRKLTELEKGVLLGKYVRQKMLKTWNRAEAGKPRVKVHTIGFFYESPDLGSFLWALARENEGSFVGMSKP